MIKKILKLKKLNKIQKKLNKNELNLKKEKIVKIKQLKSKKNNLLFLLSIWMRKFKYKKRLKNEKRKKLIKFPNQN